MVAVERGNGDEMYAQTIHSKHGDTIVTLTSDGSAEGEVEGMLMTRSYSKYLDSSLFRSNALFSTALLFEVSSWSLFRSNGVDLSRSNTKETGISGADSLLPIAVVHCTTKRATNTIL
jgi:hypothetical protein